MGKNNMRTPVPGRKKRPKAFPARASALPEQAADRLNDLSRSRILQIAAERFFSQGFSTITMDELARDLGMSKKTLYQYFPAKEDLLTAVIQAKAADIRQTLDAITREQHPSYAAKVRSVIDGLAFKLAEVQPVFVENLRRYAPAHFEQVDKIRRHHFSEVFGRLLQEGKDRQEVRPDLDIPFTVELFLRTFNAMVDSGTLYRLQLTPGRAMQMSLDLFFEGLLIRKKEPV